MDRVLMNLKILHRLFWFGLAVMLLSSGFSKIVLAQTQYGTVSGRVLDSTGAVVPDAKVALLDTSKNTKQELLTNGEGLYVFANVAAGNYTVSVEKNGFKKASVKFTLDVAERRTLDVTLEVGPITDTVSVTESNVEVNTVSGDLSRVITPSDVQGLPLLTLNPYNLVGLVAGAADTGTMTGDTRGSTNGIGGEGGGFAINGSRTSAVTYLLDGGDNNNTFITGPGQTVPLDAVEEFRVQTNSVGAEFGRNSAQANVVTKSGSNNLHGSAYEYYRGSALSTNTFDNNAKNIAKSRYVRNQFGASAGGPVIHDKTFFFGSFEGLRVRSSAPTNFFVPTAAFLGDASAATNSFINAFGGAPKSDPNNCLTAQQIVEVVEGGGAGAYAANPLINPNTSAAIPAATNLFCRATVIGPVDAGGGLAQNTWLVTGRIDHHFTDNTALSGHYSFARSDNPVGANSISPYAGFNTALASRAHNVNLTLTHSFSARLFSESRVTYNRFDQEQPLGKAPSTAPCWNYLNSFNTPTGEQIVFPGYIPNQCVAASIPSGGPQNVYQFYQGFTQAKGRHTIKYGGAYLQLRDNHTFGASENAFERTNSMQGILNGTVDRIQVAINPKGKVPGDVYSLAIDGPFVPPSFTRHYHYNEFAFYGEDSVKVLRRLTLTAGLRWEYFGVPHSPSGERQLDANFVFNSVGSPSTDILQRIRDGRFVRTNNFYQQDWNDWGPRLGFAYEVFGNNRTVVRGGYGIFYDRNFGNATFNAIQNPPNYAVITLNPNGTASIDANQFNTLGQIGGANLTIRSSGRMLDSKLRTAYSEQWNLTVEHDVLGKGIIASASYVGTNGYHLYSLNNLNPIGSCLRAPAGLLATCMPSSLASGASLSRLNQSGVTGINRRGNEGFSRYNGLSFGVRTREISGTGLVLNANYTYSHSLDNESSFFGDSLFEKFFGFGFRDPFNPALDKASSANDIRNRLTLSWNWRIPFAKGTHGLVAQAFDGWEFNGIYVAQTGVPFTVYDGSSASTCNDDGTNFCYPVIVGKSVPSLTQTKDPTPGAQNTFDLYNPSSLFETQTTLCASPNTTGMTGLACTAALGQLNPKLLSPRNLFRSPGIWNFDTGILKDFRLPWEGKKLQFRAEFFNLLNHSNLYVNPGLNNFTGPGTQITGNRGVLPDGREERRNIQLALRLAF
jgi:hypothetical protein